MAPRSKSEPDKVWAVDRSTGKAGQYTEAFLRAWPSGYKRLSGPPAEAKSAKQSTRAASTVPAGTNQEGDAS